MKAIRLPRNLVALLAVSLLLFVGYPARAAIELSELTGAQQLGDSSAVWAVPGLINEAITNTKDRPFVNATHSDFAVIPNSSDDQSTQLQAALDYAKHISDSAELMGQLGSIVYLPYGRYRANVEIPKNVDLVGAGRLMTILEAASASSPVIKFEGSSEGQTHSTVRDMTISGRNLEGSIGIDFYDGTGGESQNNFSRVINCYITRCAVGILVDSTANGKYVIYGSISECVFDSSVEGFVHVLIKNGVNALNIERNHFFKGGSPSSYYAIKTDNTFFGDHIRIVGNTFDIGYNSTAIYLDKAAVMPSTGDGIFDIIITGANRFESGGVYCAATNLKGVISDNWLAAMPRPIYIKGTSWEIHNNTINVASADQASNYDHAIEIGIGGTDNHVGYNNYGTYGSTSFSSTRVADNGTGTIIEPKLWRSVNATGTHELGDIVRLSNTTQGAGHEYYCIQAGSNNSNAVATTGTIDAGDLYHITLANKTGYNRGDYISVAGLTALVKIKWIDPESNICRLASAASGAVSDAEVTIGAPAYRVIGFSTYANNKLSRPSLNNARDTGVIFINGELGYYGTPTIFNGSAWIRTNTIHFGNSGTRAALPLANIDEDKFYPYFDTTVGKLLLWTGTQWKDTMGTVVE